MLCIALMYSICVAVRMQFCHRCIGRIPFVILNSLNLPNISIASHSLRCVVLMTQCIKPKLDIVWPPLFPQSPSVHFRVNKSNMMPTDQSQIQYNGENIPHLFQFDFPALFFFQVKLKSNVDFRMVYPCKFHAFFFPY